MADTLVVGVDTSAASLDALDAAAKLARQTKARLLLVHVEHAPSLAALGEFATSADAAMADALDQAAELARTAARERLSDTDVEWSFEVTHGDTAAEIIRLAVAHRAVAIIVGGKTHGVLSELLMGTVAEKLVRHSPMSVIVVRGAQARNLRAADAEHAARSPLSTSQVPDRVDRRRFLNEISVRLSVLSHDLGNPRVNTDDLFEDAQELNAASRRLRNLAGISQEASR